MRIDQCGDEKSPAAVYPPGMWTENQVPADFGDPAIAEETSARSSGAPRSSKIRVNIFDHRALINNRVGVCRRPNIQNYKRGQRPRQRSTVHDCPWNYRPTTARSGSATGATAIICCPRKTLRTFGREKLGNWDLLVVVDKSRLHSELGPHRIINDDCPSICKGFD